ncbi:YheC/YheD family protein [Halalkalibacter okhensis]|uniref:ATP-grasp domain-containing protein n=1 Tax=Halalkalibacter okhensis TaxID=333138 RepID=A0A0B0IJR1_9BACI|nr:YheC/YheD family protein [Halalkalibacter okhensis]KHF39856.1 hypothetical protein LQ50_12370 [Halalkalibacter okhensis]
MIGIILSSRILKLVSVRDRESWDPYILFYMKQAQKNKVDLCFYSLGGISKRDKKVNGYVYSYKTGKLASQIATLPKINLYKINSSVSSKKTADKIKKLREEGFVFLNACSKHDRSKYLDYQYLTNFNSIRPYLPETMTLTYNNLFTMLKKYPEIFIKPKRGGQGNNITIITKEGKAYQTVHIYKRNKVKVNISESELKDFFYRKFPSPYKFIVQQGIPLATFEGNKFDFRVSPQKNKLNRWQVTGVMARVASNGFDVTNVDQGGRCVYKVSKLIPLNTIKEMKRLNIKIAKAFEKRFLHLNDLGLDFAVDKNGKVWFLEANFRPNRKKANVKRNRIPFEHACSLYKKTTLIKA